MPSRPTERKIHRILGVGVLLLFVAGCAGEEPADSAETASESSPVVSESPSSPSATPSQDEALSLHERYREAVELTLDSGAQVVSGDMAAQAITVANDAASGMEVEPAECGAGLDESVVPDQDVALGIVVQPADESGQPGSMSLGVMQLSSVDDADAYLQQHRDDAEKCPTRWIEQDGMRVEITTESEEITDLDDLDEGVVLYVHTALSTVGQGADDDSAPDETVDPAAEASQRMIYARNGEEVYLYSNDTDTDVETGLEMISELRDNIAR